jgi:hypothetical protein
MRFVSGEEIRRALTFPALIKAMEASHRRARMETRDVLMGPEAAHYSCDRPPITAARSGAS